MILQRFSVAADCFKYGGGRREQLVALTTSRKLVPSPLTGREDFSFLVVSKELGHAQTSLGHGLIRNFCGYEYNCDDLPSYNWASLWKFVILDCRNCSIWRNNLAKFFKTLLTLSLSLNLFFFFVYKTISPQSANVKPKSVAVTFLPSLCIDLFTVLFLFFFFNF